MPLTGEMAATAMTAKMRLITASALVAAVLSAALLAVSFVMHSIWPIMPGVYIVASVVGIHFRGTGLVAAELVNAILIWNGTACCLALYRRRPGPGFDTSHTLTPAANLALIRQRADRIASLPRPLS